tara:strand:+ start:111 stop:515 length:405 start_codon:yes stop_codon:yes gene_type:complete
MDPVQPNASVAATGLGIRYIRDFAYGYSGTVTISHTTGEVALLEFTSGSGFIKAEVRIVSGENNDSDYNSRVYLNDLLVANTRSDLRYTYQGFDRPLIFLIPPETKVKITQERLTGSGDVDYFGVLLGRVYGAE